VRLGLPIRAAFFARPCLEVAADLIGASLVRRLPDGTRLVGRIVEVEAYLGDGRDPGSHSHGGETPRNRSMFGPPGRLYAYRSYGIHTCANVVCEAPGRGAAVLLRAAEPLEGEDRMRRHRGLPDAAPVRAVASGPGRLAQAFDLGLGDDGRSLLRGAVVLRGPSPGEALPDVGRSRRIGLRRGAALPFRFYIRGHPCVSRPRFDARTPGSEELLDGLVRQPGLPQDLPGIGVER
jgi:DNA-3-methyladenine glycosylase